MPAVLTIVMSAQLCWAGHIVRMPDGRLPKDIMHGQLSSDAHKWWGQQLWYKDILHRSLRKANIAPSTWEDLVQDHIQWRNTVRKGVEAVEKGVKEASEEKHRKHHNRTPAIAAPPGLTCKYVASSSSQGSVYTPLQNALFKLIWMWGVVLFRYQCSHIATD